MSGPSSLSLAVFPPPRRQAVAEALAATFDDDLTDAVILAGGLSLGGIYKVTIAGTPYVVRLDAPRKGFRDPTRQYACLKIASEAGVAPRLLYADAEERIAIMEFIAAGPPSWRPPSDTELLQSADALKKLHAAPLFPRLMSIFHAMEILSGMLRSSNILPAEVLAPHNALYSELVDAYPEADLVSSHNDLHPANILNSADRTYFIDWETAFAADRYLDLATLGIFVRDEAGEELLLKAYFGDELDEYRRARFYLMQQVSRLFYGISLLNIAAQQAPATRLSADVFANSRSIRATRHEAAKLATAQGPIYFAGGFFHDALAGMQSPPFRDALASVRR